MIRRWAFNITAMLSVLIVVGGAASLIVRRSYSIKEIGSWNRNWGVFYDARQRFWFQANSNPRPRERVKPTLSVWLFEWDTQREWLGFEYGSGRQIAPFSIEDTTVVAIPMWAILLTASTPLALWLRRHFRDRSRSRLQRGLCPKCSYDLRATPERCPECGWVKS